MSFCRFGWDNSDVYVFESEHGIECCGCKLSDERTAGDIPFMVSHLGDHLKAGHIVPRYAFDGLLSEFYAENPAPPEPDFQVAHENMLRSYGILRDEEDR